MKHKKFSSAILCGFELVDGRQYFGDFCPEGDSGSEPTKVCAVGAGNLCEVGNARGVGGGHLDPGWCFAEAFKAAWGFYPDTLNDEKMPWEYIYGMARAAGL